MGKKLTLLTATITVDVEELAEFVRECNRIGDEAEEARHSPKQAEAEAPAVAAKETKKANKKAAAAPVAKAKDFDEDEDTAEAEVETEDEEEKPAGKVEPLADEDFDSDDDDDKAEDEEEAKPTKGAKKISVEDVNDACKKKVHALIDKGKNAGDARAEVLAILKKKFNVKSITGLKPAQYADVITALSK